MKNLKKVLSLVLACATAFTVMAGATFTDQSDIKTTEAVDMLNQLGVINGYTDGSYKPDATVTRAEMAKMIYVARTGSTDASSYANVSTTFTDIKGHWAAGFIKYCQTNGIIAGKSTTKFDPDATVTGTEAAKMLLVTMGYDANKAGLIGSSWATKTLNLASDNNLLDDVNADMTAALPRQYAAQLIYNTLDADRVKWSTDSNSFDYYTDGNGDRETVGHQYLKLCTDVGVLNTVDSDTLEISITKDTKADSDYKPDDTALPYARTFTSVKSDYSSLLGEKVKVMYKDDKTNEVLGVYPTDDNTTYSQNANAIEDDSAKIKFGGKSYSLDTVTYTGYASNGDKNTTSSSASDALTAYYTDVNGDTVSAVLKSDSVVAGSYDPTNATATAAFGTGYYSKGFSALDTDSDTVSLVDSDNDGKIDTAIITQVLGGKVTYVSNSKVLVDGVSAKLDDDIDPADDNVASGLATNDWAGVSYDRFKDGYKVEKADSLTGTLTGVKESQSNDVITDYKQYKIGGTWYTGSTENGADNKSVKATSDVSYVLVNGIVYNIKKTSGTSGASDLTDVALVTGKSTGAVDNEVKLQFFNDTTKTVTVDEGDKDPSTTTVSDDGLWDFNSLKIGTVYDVSASGSDYQFETLNTADDYYGDYTALSKGDGSLSAVTDNDTISGYKIDDDAQVIIYVATTDPSKDNISSSNVDVITGKQFKSAYEDGASKTVSTSGNDVAFKAEMSGIDRIGALCYSVTGTNESGTTYDHYAYVVSDPYKIGNADIGYTIWDGSKNIEVTDEDNRIGTGTATSKNRVMKGAVIGYSSISSDNVIKDAEVIPNVTSSEAGVVRTAVTSVSNDQKTITVDANIKGGKLTTPSTDRTELDISDSDVTVLYVDSNADDAKIGVENGSITEAAKGNTKKYPNSKYTPNVLVYSLNGDDDNELVVVDVGSEIADDDTPYTKILDTASTSAAVTATADVTTPTTTAANYGAAASYKLNVTGTDIDATAPLSATVTDKNGNDVSSKFTIDTGKTFTDGALNVATTATTPAGTYSVVVKAGTTGAKALTITVNPATISTVTVSGVAAADLNAAAKYKEETFPAFSLVTAPTVAADDNYTIDSIAATVKTDNGTTSTLDKDDVVTVSFKLTPKDNYTFGTSAPSVADFTAGTVATDGSVTYTQDVTLTA